MIEMGISVIAACLPTICLLFGGVTVQSILHSVRSTLSLHSQHSNARSSAKGRRGSHDTTGVDGGGEFGLEKYENIRLTEVAGELSQISQVGSEHRSHV